MFASWLNQINEIFAFYNFFAFYKFSILFLLTRLVTIISNADVSQTLYPSLHPNKVFYSGGDNQINYRHSNTSTGGVFASEI